MVRRAGIPKAVTIGKKRTFASKLSGTAVFYRVRPHHVHRRHRPQLVMDFRPYRHAMSVDMSLALRRLFDPSHPCSNSIITGWNNIVRMIMKRITTPPMMVTAVYLKALHRHLSFALVLFVPKAWGCCIVRVKRASLCSSLVVVLYSIICGIRVYRRSFRVM